MEKKGEKKYELIREKKPTRRLIKKKKLYISIQLGKIKRTNSGSETKFEHDHKLCYWLGGYF